MKRALIPAILVISAVVAPRIPDVVECRPSVSRFATSFARPLGWALWEEFLSVEITRGTDRSPAANGSPIQNGPFACWIFKAFVRGAFERGLSAVSEKKYSTVSISPSLIRRGSRA